MAKKKRRFNDDPRELIQMAKNAAVYKATAGDLWFTVMGTFAMYTMWKDFGWNQERLNRLNQKIDEIYNDEKITFDHVKEVIKEKAGLEIRPCVLTDADVKVNRKHKFYYNLERKMLAPSNYSYERATEYQYMALYALSQMGFGDKRLNRVADGITNMMRTCDTNEKFQIVRRELAEYTGMATEMPVFSVSGNN